MEERNIKNGPRANIEMKSLKMALIMFLPVHIGLSVGCRGSLIVKLLEIVSYHVCGSPNMGIPCDDSICRPATVMRALLIEKEMREIVTVKRKSHITRKIGS